MNKIKKILLMICYLSSLCLFTFSFGIFAKMTTNIPKIVISLLINIIIGSLAILAMNLSKMKFKVNFTNYKQYIIGTIIAILLSLIIAVVPSLLGVSFVGNHLDFSILTLLINFVVYIFVIGPVEEVIFRVYIQETLTNLLPKYKWIGVIIAALLFGFWHLINGSFIQVLFTFGIGLVFGFCKYYINNCEYLGISLSHGLYDFLNIVTRMFIIK